MKKIEQRRECTIKGHTIEIPFDLADQRLAEEIRDYLTAHPEYIGWGKSFQLVGYGNDFYHFDRSEHLPDHLEVKAGHKA